MAMRAVLDLTHAAAHHPDDRLPRALRQDYDHNDFKWDVTMQGPILGAEERF